MNKTIKTILGAITFWAAIYSGLLTYAMLFGQNSESISKLHNLLIGSEIGAISLILCFLITIVYIVLFFKSKRVPEEKKLRWGIAIFMGTTLVFPFFFCFYVWPEKST